MSEHCPLQSCNAALEPIPKKSRYSNCEASSSQACWPAEQWEMFGASDVVVDEILIKVQLDSESRAINRQEMAITGTVLRSIFALFLAFKGRFFLVICTVALV